MQAVTLTDDLAAMPPGPGLAAALHAVELSAVRNDRMLDVLTAQQRQLSHEQARMAAVLAELGRCSGDPEPGQVARLAGMDRYAPDETRAALRWTRTAAEFEHDLAETVVHTMPALFGAWLAGSLDRPRILVFHRYLLGLCPEQITAICRVAVPRAPRLTTGQLAVLLRRMVLAVDPAAAERWYRKGVRERWGSLDIRGQIRTDDGAVLHYRAEGVMEMNEAVQRYLEGTASTEFSDHYARLYFRMESGDDRYAWVNRTVFVGEPRLVVDGDARRVEVRIHRVS